ncbi:MAG: proton-conducting transporter membrane subunit, partial [Lentisphaerota bacterium]
MKMTNLLLILMAVLMVSLSGVPGLFGRRRSALGQRIASALMTLGGAVGLCGAALSLLPGAARSFSLAWPLPIGGFVVDVDALSVFFLVPVFLIPVMGSFFGMEYWKQSLNPLTGKGLRFFYGLLTGSMAMVVMARDSVLFLIVWEVMAVSAFFLAATDHTRPEVQRAAWIYLVAAHVGTGCLMALFCLMRRLTGSFDLHAINSISMPPAMAGSLFVLAVAGFGFKSGIMPLHFWLPGAHANAPSHVSAVMSGVMLKMGVYGMMRMASLLPAPEMWWGAGLLGVGVVTGILGMAFALGQSDLKRLLAYSSIENIGIITMGLGLALLGRVMNRFDLVALGLGGSLLHVWNHSLFKSLLFLNSGSIIHAAHTRNMDLMGGLAARMPQTAGLFLLGAVAICGLPPLNGFVGEWLIYLGLFRSVIPADGPVALMTGLAVVALAMIGALALACFVKLYGAVFQGTARGEHGAKAHDPGPWMLRPLMMLGAGCVLLGLLPQLVIPILNRAVSAWLAGPVGVVCPIASVAPLGWLTATGLCLLFGG